MTLKLKEPVGVRYSPMEKAVFGLLKKGKESRVDTEWLTPRVYKQLNREEPLSSRVVVTGAIRSLVKKARRNRERWQIKCTPMAGPNSIEVWIE